MGVAAEPSVFVFMLLSSAVNNPNLEVKADVQAILFGV